MEPVSRPIQSFPELDDWIPGAEPWNICRVPLAQRHLDSKKPKVLLCHDMAGGYHQDRFVQGVFEAPSYRFQFWNLVDIFVYFSHTCVTLPPVVWVSAAHREGVRVLGNIITEGDFGELQNLHMIYGPILNDASKSSFSPHYADILGISS